MGQALKKKNLMKAETLWLFRKILKTWNFLKAAGCVKQVWQAQDPANLSRWFSPLMEAEKERRPFWNRMINVQEMRLPDLMANLSRLTCRSWFAPDSKILMEKPSFPASIQLATAQGALAAIMMAQHGTQLFSDCANYILRLDALFIRSWAGTA